MNERGSAAWAALMECVVLVRGDIEADRRLKVPEERFSEGWPHPLRESGWGTLSTKTATPLFFFAGAKKRVVYLLAIPYADGFGHRSQVSQGREV